MTLPYAIRLSDTKARYGREGQQGGRRISIIQYTAQDTDMILTDKKARDELASSAKGKKGPLNTGSQGIKKSGKK